jgi:hypothetical protein
MIGSSKYPLCIGEESKLIVCDVHPPFSYRARHGMTLCGFWFTGHTPGENSCFEEVGTIILFNLFHGC